VAEIIAKEVKPHRIGETLIDSACATVVRTKFDTDIEEEIKKIPLLDVTANGHY
jgi:hypothetical protein